MVRALDRHHRLSIIGFSDPIRSVVLAMLTEHELYEGMHMVTPDGVVHSAGAAAVELIGVLGFPGSVVRTIASRHASVRRVIESGYEWIAAHRGGVGRLLPHRDPIRVLRQVSAQGPA